MIHGPGSSSKKNNIALKAKKSSKKIVSSSEESENSSPSDEESNSSDELAIFVKRFNKKFGRKFGIKLKQQGHFIAECPEKADDDKEKKGFKKHPHKKSHDRHKKKDWNKYSAHKKKVKYYSRAHVGECNSDSSSSEESSDSESEDGIAGLAIAISSDREKSSLFDSPNSSEDVPGDDRNSPSCFMAKSSKVPSPSEV
ncbi:suppressor protein SRP40-like [Brachypodium distachyon]|uniref:suppressor protein SRP40-like n=1 Tax=Brachypodium distachyon TaxID=15368 RepID=UPI00052FE022|nr:suppressor protein SRP40-like [Brachypodium distachyon]|eukprot:XP_010236565.1 suppressor protein SRP40-like [Brachypodium distachyon]